MAMVPFDGGGDAASELESLRALMEHKQAMYDVERLRQQLEAQDDESQCHPNS